MQFLHSKAASTLGYTIPLTRSNSKFCFTFHPLIEIDVVAFLHRLASSVNG